MATAKGPPATVEPRSAEGDNLLASYLQDISESTPLSSPQEADLARRIRRGNEEARNRLVEANLRFVVAVSKQYQGRGLTLAELISAGNVGLMTAAERFDEKRGFKFISYAVWWVRQGIMKSLTEQSTVRVPLSRLDMLSKVSRTLAELQQAGEPPSIVRVAEKLDCRAEESNRPWPSVSLSDLSRCPLRGLRGRRGVQSPRLPFRSTAQRRGYLPQFQSRCRYAGGSGQAAGPRGRSAAPPLRVGPGSLDDVG